MLTVKIVRVFSIESVCIRKQQEFQKSLFRFSTFLSVAILNNCDVSWLPYCSRIDLQPLFKYMDYFIYNSHHFTSHGRNELNKLTSLPMCGFIAQPVEHRTGISRRSRVRIPLKPWFFQASSFQLLQLENLLRWSFFTLIYNRSSNIWIISYILHIISLWVITHEKLFPKLVLRVSSGYPNTLKQLKKIGCRDVKQLCCCSLL